MHWAINDWNLSPEASRPEGTQQIDDKAVQTPFKDGKSIHLTFPEADCPSRSALKPAFENAPKTHGYAARHHSWSIKKAKVACFELQLVPCSNKHK